MSFARPARTRVLPTPHIPNGLTIAPATEVRQRYRGVSVIMPDKAKVENGVRFAQTCHDLIVKLIVLIMTI